MAAQMEVNANVPRSQTVGFDACFGPEGRDRLSDIQDPAVSAK